MHLIQAQTNQGLTLILLAPNWTADLGNGYRLGFFGSHGFFPSRP
jgi:hypothetical protein